MEARDAPHVGGAVVDHDRDDPQPGRGAAVQEAGDRDQHRRGQQPGRERADRVGHLDLVDPVGVDGEVDHPHRQVGDAEDHRVLAERLRHRERGDQHRAHRAEQRDPGDSVVGVQGVGEPGVAGPRPPDHGQHQHPLAEALPRRVGGHQAGDLGEREYEDEVEEELEWGDPILLGRLRLTGEGCRRRLHRRSGWRRRLVGALELGAQLERPRVELGVDQLETAPELGDDRLLDLRRGSSRGPRRRRCRPSRDPTRARAPRRRARAPRAAPAEPSTTRTPPTWAPPAIRRCPIPASLVRSRALTLQAPGQYSPGTSPIRASTPSSRRASVTIVAIASKRSWVRLDRAARPRSPKRTRACAHGRPRPARRRAAPPARTRPRAPPRPRARIPARRGPASRRRARGPGGGGGRSGRVHPPRPGSGSPRRRLSRTRRARESPRGSA